MPVGNHEKLAIHAQNNQKSEFRILKELRSDLCILLQGFIANYRASVLINDFLSMIYYKYYLDKVFLLYVTV